MLGKRLAGIPFDEAIRRHEGSHTSERAALPSCPASGVGRLEISCKAAKYSPAPHLPNGRSSLPSGISLLKVVVRDAVWSERVSSLISLFYREFTGKMQILGLIQASRWLASPQISAISEPNSLRTEQGILARLTGKQIVRISELP